MAEEAKNQHHGCGCGGKCGSGGGQGRRGRKVRQGEPVDDEGRINLGLRSAK